MVIDFSEFLVAKILGVGLEPAQIVGGSDMELPQAEFPIILKKMEYFCIFRCYFQQDKNAFLQHPKECQMKDKDNYKTWQNSRSIWLE